MFLNFIYIYKALSTRVCSLGDDAYNYISNKLCSVITNNMYVYIHFDFVQGETKESSDKLRGRQTLEKWLNKSMKIKMSDGRTLIGMP